MMKKVVFNRGDTCWRRNRYHGQVGSEDLHGSALAGFQNYLCILRLFSKSPLTINGSPVPLKKAMTFISLHFTEREQACCLDEKEVSPAIGCFLFSIYKVIGIFIVMISSFMFSDTTFKVDWVETFIFPFKEISLGELFTLCHIHMICLKFTMKEDLFFPPLAVPLH